MTVIFVGLALPLFMIMSMLVAIAFGVVFATRQEWMAAIFGRATRWVVGGVVIGFVALSVVFPSIVESRARVMAEGMSYCLDVTSQKSLKEPDAFSFIRIANQANWGGFWDGFSEFYIVLVVQKLDGTLHPYNWSFLHGFRFRDDVGGFTKMYEHACVAREQQPHQ
jgi:hypothetical protein